MDFSRMGMDRLNIEFKDLKSGNMTQRTFAEVILIDRTNPSQICFILKNDKLFNHDDLENFKEGFYKFNKDDFMILGEVQSINKKQKFITLKDQNSISYNHLIIVTGTSSSMTYEFIAGVNTLVDAIRVRKKIPSAFPDAVKSSSKKKMKSSTNTANKSLNLPRKIDIKGKMKLSEKESGNSLNSQHKRLYEVQI